MIIDFLIYHVKPEEYLILKEKEDDIISAVKEEFDDVSNPWPEELGITFRYNPPQNIIGIYLEKDGKRILIKNDDGLDGVEHYLVGSFNSILEERLSNLRLSEDNWID